MLGLLVHILHRPTSLTHLLDKVYCIALWDTTDRQTTLYFNHFKPNGVKWLPLKASGAILV